MDRQPELHVVLEAFLEPGHKAYFQPPANVQMEYPAIVYGLDDIDTQFAGNNPYLFAKRWTVTYIDRDPTSDVPDKIVALPRCVFSRRYAVDNLNHTAFTLYF